MKNFILTCSLLLVSVIARATDINTFTSKADAFFNTYVNNGSVDYKEIMESPAGIEALKADIATMKMAGLSAAQKKAFYINAYNLLVIYQVSKFYPLKSPLDRSGFFDRVKHEVAGESMTLNYLEIKKLILAYKDARIHFVLACAAKSCPPLASFAYLPEKLDEQLELRTKNALNDPDWLKVNTSEKYTSISKIFEWYQKDFQAYGGGILNFINKYRMKKIPSNYDIRYYEYNWALNDN